MTFYSPRILLAEFPETGGVRRNIQGKILAFDRFLRWGHHTIPLWHEVEDWYVHASGLGFPDSGRVRVDPAERWFWIR